MQTRYRRANNRRVAFDRHRDGVVDSSIYSGSAGPGVGGEGKRRPTHRIGSHFGFIRRFHCEYQPHDTRNTHTPPHPKTRKQSRLPPPWQVHSPNQLQRRKPTHKVRGDIQRRDRELDREETGAKLQLIESGRNLGRFLDERDTFEEGAEEADDRHEKGDGEEGPQHCAHAGRGREAEKLQ